MIASSTAFLRPPPPSILCPAPHHRPRLPNAAGNYHTPLTHLSNGCHRPRQDQHAVSALDPPARNACLPRLCCLDAVSCDALRYVVAPTKALGSCSCLSGWMWTRLPCSNATHSLSDPWSLSTQLLMPSPGYSSESCGYCKDASNGCRKPNARTCMFPLFPLGDQPSHACIRWERSSSPKQHRWRRWLHCLMFCYGDSRCRVLPRAPEHPSRFLHQSSHLHTYRAKLPFMLDHTVCSTRRSNFDASE